jgi:glyoxylase-like metal-dependent hydrolase (beta-lactamase superfamily II)
MVEVFKEILPNLYVFQDTCNTYVLKDGSEAILIDIGDGEVCKHLKKLNIEKIEWILFTHHHREVCQGFQKVRHLDVCNNVKVAVPIYESELFISPRFIYQHLNDSKWSEGGVAYVRPPRDSIPVTLYLADGDVFKWRSYTLTIRLTPGNSPGAISFLCKVAGKLICFCGDVIMAGGKLHNYYDSEWDYGYGYGIKALWSSVELLRNLKPDILCPSQGWIISAPELSPDYELYNFANKLWSFRSLLLRDYTDRDQIQSESISQPTTIEGIRRISSHLYKVAAPGNMYILLSKTGRSLLIDCGSLKPEAERWLNEKFNMMESTFGLKTVDAIIPTHYHGDHLLDIPIIRSRYNSEVWAYENMAEILEFPGKFNLMWLLPAYQTGYKDVHVDRILHEGEVLKWEEYQFDVFNLPGQTLYAIGISGRIDGKLIVFTGDNIFYSTNGSGHEAFVTRNASILEEGYIKCAEILNRLQPELILGGHGQEIPQPSSQLKKFLEWSYTFRETLKGLSPYCEYEYLIDPYWAKFYPYKTKATQGSFISLRLLIRNHKYREIESIIRLMLPMGWKTSSEGEKKYSKLKISTKGQNSVNWKIKIPKSASNGTYLITANLIIDGRKVGEFPEAIVEVN